MINTQSRKEYLRRIHKVQDYIENHLYDTPSLKELSDIAGFSEFHFHRIFKGIVKETLSQYINRLKLERALNLLIHRLDMTITDVAYHCGFTDSAVFSRAFKNYYKISPKQYRDHYSKNCKEPYKISQYNEYVSKIQYENKGECVKGKIEIIRLPSKSVAYVRYMGTYKNLASAFQELLEKLFKYAKEQNIRESEETKILTIYHDNPEFTEATQLRTSICMTIPEGFKVQENSDIGSMIIPSGKYVVGHFNISPNGYSDAWDFMYGEWLTNSAYKPRDSFPFEVYLNNSEQEHFVDIYLPIERME